MVSALFRADQLTTLAHHYATRQLRTLIDQAQPRYERKPCRGRKILMFCGRGDTDELAGQLVADLAESDGYEVYFGGGGIANDEILSEVGEQRPDTLLMFSSSPPDAPNIRMLIDTIRGVGACPNMQIVVGGGVFNRAEGLAAEIGADLWARTPGELLERLDGEHHRRARPEQRTVGRSRKAPTAGAPTGRTAAA
jgi:methanogenic corrinoid protein MtbC1